MIFGYPNKWNVWLTLFIFLITLMYHCYITYLFFYLFRCRHFSVQNIVVLCFPSFLSYLAFVSHFFSLLILQLFHHLERPFDDSSNSFSSFYFNFSYFYFQLVFLFLYVFCILIFNFVILVFISLRSLFIASLV